MSSAGTLPQNTDGREPVTLPIPVGRTSPRLFLHDRPETISNFVRKFGVWQRPITSFIVSYLQPGDVFVDVGANIGYFSVYAGLCVGGDGRVHAIEPDSDNAALLRANLALNGLANVQLHQTAVSDYCGEATLFRGGFNAGAHSLLPKDDLTPRSKVPVTTLSRLLEGEPEIKLMKIDVQGAELSALRSMAELLSKCETKPGIIMEFSPIDLQRNGELDEFFEFVSQNGYSLRAFIANERAKTKPPQIRRATLRQIAEDLLYANDAAEFDLLLLSHR